VDRNKAAAEARRRLAGVESSVDAELLRRWRTTGDRGDGDTRWADVTGWWRDGGLLRRLGPALVELFDETAPTVVLGPQSRGALLGALAATALGVGLVEVRKDDGPLSDSDSWYRHTTTPDYRDRQLTLGFPRTLLQSGDRVLFVDDWIDTGSQALGARALTVQAGAEWLGAAVIVDGLTDARRRRDLDVRSLLRSRDLWR
jgi:adenine phosphoribosyltransferase